VRRAARLLPPRAASSSDGPLELVSDPLLRRALREPVAFAGGMLAGAHTNARNATSRRHVIASLSRRAGAACLRLGTHARTQAHTRQRCAALCASARAGASACRLLSARTHARSRVCSFRLWLISAFVSAFWLHAGFLKLDLAADPLADWVRRTAAVAGPPEAPNVAEQQTAQQAAAEAVVTATGGDSADAAPQ
jgi:hypothetical protein